jgi:squalene cyclase
MVMALRFRERHPDHRSQEVSAAIRRGREFLREMQRPDGSWYHDHDQNSGLTDIYLRFEMPILIPMRRRRYGSWGCCFTYGCWFGIHGLVLSGEPTDSPSIRSAVQFLRSHQNANGGWGEDFSSCYDKDYAPSGARRYGVGGSSIVQTSWALLALLEAGVGRPFPDWNRSILTEIYLCHACSCQEIVWTGTAAQCGAAGRDPDLEEGEVLALQRGCRFLVSRQRGTGDWPQEGIAGVFNRSCGISYTQYRNIFPIWALGMYARRMTRQP